MAKISPAGEPSSELIHLHNFFKTPRFHLVNRHVLLRKNPGISDHDIDFPEMFNSFLKTTFYIFLATHITCHQKTLGFHLALRFLGCGALAPIMNGYFRSLFGKTFGGSRADAARRACY